MVFGFTLVYFAFPGVVDLPSVRIKKPSFSFLEAWKKKDDKKVTMASVERVEIDHSPKVIDSYKGVSVFYNGKTSNVYGRSVSADGYNIGLKYQCVEFVKRFYYENKRHKMPNAYGHAKEMFDPSVADGGFNKGRGLYQFKNGGAHKPKKDAIIVFGAAPFNKFGHVAIISDVGHDFVEIVQQNPGIGNKSRGTYRLTNVNGRWRIDDPYLVGWLHK